MAKNIQKIKNASKESFKKKKKTTQTDKHLKIYSLIKTRVLEPFSFCSYISK